MKAYIFAIVFGHGHAILHGHKPGSYAPLLRERHNPTQYIYSEVRIVHGGWLKVVVG